MAPDSRSTPLILLVDDSPTQLEVLCNLLEEVQTELCVATEGERALELAESEAPDLILMDVVMPGLDGYSVCERLKAREATREIPVIFLTARSETEDVVRGFAAGAVDYVGKPFNPPELLARVRTHLELKRTRDAERLLLSELQASLAEIHHLSGLIPICAGCKKVRDDRGFWQQVEDYIARHSEARFSHGYCPDCVARLFPDFKDAPPPEP